jgi:hypothetical protein
MHYERYETTQGESALVYEFVSQGLNVKKIVIFSPTSLPNLFNLGFGDKDVSTGDFDDIIVTNNGDSLKVLATVASCVDSFTKDFPKAMVVATGSTRTRTRLYRMVISNNLETIRLDFQVYGLLDDDWEVFLPNIDYQAFLVIRKKRL